jgi:hypothetical protein
MDLRAYYQKIRDVAKNMPEEYVIVVSNETPDGGKAGVRSEVQRDRAARLVVDGKARLATPEEAEQFRTELAEARSRAEQAAAAAKMQVTVISEHELRALKDRFKSPKG